jgi:hypothetical protein
VTRALIGTRVTANQLTVVMTAAGVLSGLALLIPGVFGTLLAVVLMQVYLLPTAIAAALVTLLGDTAKIQAGHVLFLTRS